MYMVEFFSFFVVFVFVIVVVGIVKVNLQLLQTNLD